MTANKVLGCQCHHTALGKMKSSVLGRYKCKAWTCRSLPCCGCSLFADLQEGGQGASVRGESPRVRKQDKMKAAGLWPAPSVIFRNCYHLLTSGKKQQLNVNVFLLPMLRPLFMNES